MTRIALVHATIHSLAPIAEAFRHKWPEAKAVNILDDSLYADVSPEGRFAADIPKRIESLFRHAELSGADGIVFTGSTFGPLVDRARTNVSVPVMKPDEAMAEVAVQRGRRIALFCTAGRAIPVIRQNLQHAAEVVGTNVVITAHHVERAQAVKAEGRSDLHDEMIIRSILENADADVFVLGQISMAGVLDRAPASIRERLLASPNAAVEKIRRLIDEHRAAGRAGAKAS